MVSAVILNYMNPELTGECVSELLEAAEEAAVEIEVIVVDNSANKTADRLRQILPEDVIIIENEINKGFSKANNQGIDRAKGDLVLIMNNDLFINAETLETGINYIKTHDNTGVWAPKLIDRQGRGQRSCSQFPTLTGLVTEYLLKLQYDNRIAKDAMQAGKPVKVDTVIGACMLIPENVLQEVGGFDEDYFFNVEDVDLCLKIKKQGYEVIYDSRCSAIHLVGASQNSHWHNNRHLHEARILYFKKNHGSFTSAIAEWIIKTGLGMRRFKHSIFSG